MINDLPSLSAANAERAVLSTMACNFEEAFRRGISELTEEHFHDSRHRTIFQAMRQIGGFMDMNLLYDRLSDRLDDVGGADYFMDTVKFAPGVSALDAYLSTLHEFKMRRDMSNLATELHRAAFDTDTPTLEAIGYLNSLLSAITAQNGHSDLMTCQEAALLELDSQPVSGLALGVPALDSILDGVGPGEVCVIAARPGNGKTVLGLQAASSASLAGCRTMFITLEVSAREIGRRLLAMRSSINLDTIKHKKFSAYEEEILRKCTATMADDTLKIFDTYGDLNKLANKARQQAITYGLDCLVIDYVGLIKRVSAKGKTTNDEISEITSGIKGLARELQIPIIMLCQLNRETERIERPTLKNLRDSGSIEQDADKVVFIYHDKGQNESYTPLMWLDCQKNRQGRDGRALVRFNKPLARFESIRHGEEHD